MTQDKPLEWKDNYPTDIFIPISKDRLRLVNGYLKANFGFPLDRLSAHIARELMKNRLKEVQSAKRLCKRNQDRYCDEILAELEYLSLSSIILDTGSLIRIGVQLNNLYRNPDECFNIPDGESGTTNRSELVPDENTMTQTFEEQFPSIMKSLKESGDERGITPGISFGIGYFQVFCLDKQKVRAILLLHIIIPSDSSAGFVSSISQYAPVHRAMILFFP